MGQPEPSSLRTILEAIGDRLAQLFLSPGEISSLMSLAAALVVAASVLALRRWRRGRRARVRVLARALFRTFRPRPSQRADLFYFLFNAFACGAIIGGALLSFAWVSGGTTALLVRAFGPAAPSPLPEVAGRVLVTLVVFLAYEFGYWVDHWLSHRIPILWDFHKVHHSAEELTPLTVWRVHPVETLKFANILAVFTGVANGAGQYAVGGEVSGYAVSGANVILVGFIYAYLHLQHSHIWITFRGWLGHVLQSPAHHQIHHSSDPAHHNKNLGSCLAVWDWMFGTLYVPGKTPEKLHFGITPSRGQDHSVIEILVRPFIRAGRRIPRYLRRYLGLPGRQAAAGWQGRSGAASSAHTGAP